MDLNNFIGNSQLLAIREACKGEEGEYFKAMLRELESKIVGMPKTYETDGQGDDALVILHYFLGGSDWWVTEKDAGSPEDQEPGVQAQAFGFTCLNGDTENAEMGYISIAELIQNGVELDLYYKPEKIGDIKARLSA